MKQQYGVLFIDSSEELWLSLRARHVYCLFTFAGVSLHTYILKCSEIKVMIIQPVAQFFRVFILGSLLFDKINQTLSCIKKTRKHLVFITHISLFTSVWTAEYLGQPDNKYLHKYLENVPMMRTIGSIWVIKETRSLHRNVVHYDCRSELCRTTT